ncbi:MAG: alpha/beta fold hydrolase [Gammaproteobacteria bacterium]|nr:MAG: alpha/beta fold hydrolase [Gammaproteobacteria bacterium]
MTNKQLTGLIKRLMVYIIAIPLLFLAFLYFFQDHMMYYPRPIDPLSRKVIDKYFPGADIELRSDDGTRLHGWYWHPQSASLQESPVVIFFGGNAEEVSGMFLELAGFKDYGVATLNYRGYGLSEGRPAEKSMFQDALILYDYLINKEGYKAEQIIVMGRSLGTGVAVHLASQRDVRSVVLISPYDSMISLASHHYPYAPVKWLLKHRYDSLSVAGKINKPLFILYAGADRIVPPVHAKRLAQAWAGKTRVIEIEKANHNSMASYPEYLHTLKQFLRESTELH